MRRLLLTTALTIMAMPVFAEDAALILGVERYRNLDRFVGGAAVAGAATELEAAGYAVDGFLAAHGNYGSWLVRMSNAGKNYQLIWDGKAGKLLHHVAISSGGWDELSSCDIAEKDTVGFVAGTSELLQKQQA